ncbi:MAG: VOC family protein [Myxococcota bacterium]
MRLGYVIVYVNDVERTLKHYEEAFSMKTAMLHESKTYGELDTGSTVLAFAAFSEAQANGITIVPTSPERPPQAQELVFVTPDVAAALTRATENGATLVRPPEDKPWGQTVAYVRDINGVLVELATPIK